MRGKTNGITGCNHHRGFNLQCGVFDFTGQNIRGYAGADYVVLRREFIHFCQWYADPLPQALVLTAIVIGFAMTAFLVVLSIRARADLGNDHVDGKLPVAKNTRQGASS